MKRVILVIVTICLYAACAGSATVLSVDAVDNHKSSSRVTIRLSEPASYRFSGSGKFITIELPDARLGTETANYRRLSFIIDRISLIGDDNGSVISIRTMDAYQLTHKQIGSVIQVDIVNPAAPPAPAVTSPRPKPAVEPKPEAVTTPETAPQPAPELTKTDSVTAPKTTVKPAFKPTRIPFMQNLRLAIKANPYLYLAALLLALVIALLLLLPKSFWMSVKNLMTPVPREKKVKPVKIKEPKPLKIKEPKAPKPVREKPLKAKKADLGLDGATLIMDSETKSRMVMKLLGEGWTARQISREMKIPLKEIESIVSSAQFSDR